MFERVIAQTIQKITAETVQERSLIPLLDILQDDRIPSRIKPFFETEVHWWLYNEMLARGANKRFDYDNPELTSLINYMEQVQFRHARFEREEFVTVLDSAVKLIYNYLCRPQTTLKWYIFRGQPVKPLREVMLRFSAFVDYEYFRNVFIEWVDRKRAERPTFDAISATEFERVIRRTDDQILLNCTVEDLLDIMDPLFDFIGEGPQKSLPVDALIIFFDDKNIKKLVDQLEAYHKRGGEAVTRDEFVTLLDELLSSAEDEPEVDYSAVYQNDELDDVVREHLLSGVRAGGDIPESDPRDHYPQGDIESGTPGDHIPHAHTASTIMAESPIQPPVTEWGSDGAMAPMAHGHALQELDVITMEDEPTAVYLVGQSYALEYESDEEETAPSNGFHADERHLGSEPLPRVDEHTGGAAVEMEEPLPAEAFAFELDEDEDDEEEEDLDEVARPHDFADGEEEPAIDPYLDLEWSEEDEAAIVEVPPVEEPREDASAIDDLIDDDDDDDEPEPSSASEPSSADQPSSATEMPSVSEPSGVRETPSVPALALTPEPTAHHLSEGDMAASHAPMIDVRRFIDAALERKVVKKIFAKDRAAYEEALGKINAAPTWRAASQALDELFSRYNVDSHSRTAIRFTDSVYGRYLRKG